MANARPNEELQDAKIVSSASKETTPVRKFLNTKTNQPVEIEASIYDKLVSEKYPVDHLEEIV